MVKAVKINPKGQNNEIQIRQGQLFLDPFLQVDKGKVMKTAINFVAFLVVMDLIIVLGTIAQISQGIETPHIAFWDAQIEFVINWII